MKRPVFPLALLLAVLIAFARPAAALEHALPTPVAAPDFTGIAQWYNTAPLTMAGLRGRVVLVDFWTYSCINCLRTLPMLKAWDTKYRDQGLTIVGVHAPEFDFEKDPKNVAQAIKRFGIVYPVALDSALATWGAYQNQYWPAEYLIDRQGRIVATHFGEGEPEVMERNIQELLGTKTRVEASADTHFNRAESPETYLGRARAMNFVGTLQDGLAPYRFPAALQTNQWALDGQWTVTGEHIVAGQDGALRYRFNAGKVFLVLGPPPAGSGMVRVLLDGKLVTNGAGSDVKDGTVTVDQQRLYNLLDFKDDAMEGTLELRVGPGVSAYAFTFGA